MVPPRQSLLNSKDASIHELGESETRDILFPHQQEELTQIAIDIGGSLAKVVWFSKVKGNNEFGGRMNFEKFETHNIEQLIDFLKGVIQQIGIPKHKLVIKATGGGSVKYYDRIKEELGVAVDREDEMECLITGLNFLVREVPNEVFTYDERRNDAPLVYEEPPKELFPYLIVNIGSGVSILKVTSFETYERISGTSLGGGTLWGLLSLLTDADNFDEMLELSKRGDNANVDMLVGDIYGGDYPKIGLKATTIASSFGKVFKAPKSERKKFREEDISRSLLFLVSNNIGQIAYLNAQAHGIQRIYFSGFFIRGHPVTMKRSTMLSISGLGNLNLGAVGALDVLPTNCSFPLLRSKELYNPDSIDLSDSRLQYYWIDLLDNNLKDLVKLVLQWQKDTENVTGRAAAFESIFRDHLQRLRKEPHAYGKLSIRSLLNLREQCLREMGFNDIFETVKKDENTVALAQYSKVVAEMDAYPEAERIKHLTDNILAGNMYDWGSHSVQQLLITGELVFQNAKDKVNHPAKFDDLEQLTKKLIGPGYKKAVIFVDNSGADIILGIIPFARYLLSKGTTVILAANTRPSINDVTCYELDGILAEIALTDFVIGGAIKARTLKVIGTGSASPCLDLRYVDAELGVECADADLVVIEGMGRAIHTNFYVKFSVDCLKIAVFKNPQVAEDLGASMYDGIRIFEQV
ncbi:fumble-domain-containing protein [Rhizoclosmatium globosum]|uniref:pantothenate kinase n=1 Tax=Rhizoclosmatium globosum TaxID=329046 RepID=A0A1Y2C5N6_9FUNG|nr:fumble-domain-containing protein [Rhizoclosmatium globosum]|eukprot:ORY42350.1 fumble-domain-containing protein [Rhizoclosmatium globosum]